MRFIGSYQHEHLDIKTNISLKRSQYVRPQKRISNLYGTSVMDDQLRDLNTVVWHNSYIDMKFPILRGVHILRCSLSNARKTVHLYRCTLLVTNAFTVNPIQVPVVAMARSLHLLPCFPGHFRKRFSGSTPMSQLCGSKNRTRCYFHTDRNGAPSI